MKKFLLSLLLGAAVVPVFADEAATTEFGYCKDPYISVADGFGLAQDGTLGFAIRLPHDQISKYSGGRIIGMTIGAADNCNEQEINVFLRKGTPDPDNPKKLTLSDENLASTTDYISWKLVNGWQGELTQVLLDKGWTIPEDLDEDLFFGLYATVKGQKRIIGSSMQTQRSPDDVIYYTESYDPENTTPNDWDEIHLIPAFNSNNNPVIKCIIELPAENYSNVLQIVNAYMPNICPVGVPTTACLFLKNDGSKPISNLEISLSLGDESNDYPITFSGSPMDIGYESPNRNPIKVPLKALGTGKHVLTITKVNGEPNGALEKDKTCELDIVGVPTEIAMQHIRRPLYEFITSETDHMGGIYEKDFVVPAIKAYKNRITYLPHHTGDKFAQNPTDTPVHINGEPQTIELSDADRWSIMLCKKDINSEMIRVNCIDRTLQMKIAELSGKTSMDQVLTACFADKTAIEYYIPEALNTPTFASVELENTFNPDTKLATIKASGTIADLLPEGEKAKLSIFVVEETIWSNSQELPTSEATETRFPDGNFDHYRVIRETVTDFWGEELEPGKDFVKTYNVVLDNPKWNPDHMRVIAVIQRPETNHYLKLDVLNSAEEPLTETYEESGISQIEASGDANGAIFDLQGRKLASPARGINIINGKKILVK